MLGVCQVRVHNRLLITRHALETSGHTVLGEAEGCVSVDKTLCVARILPTPDHVTHHVQTWGHSIRDRPGASHIIQEISVLECPTSN